MIDRRSVAATAATPHPLALASATATPSSSGQARALPEVEQGCVSDQVIQQQHQQSKGRLLVGEQEGEKACQMLSRRLVIKEKDSGEDRMAKDGRNKRSSKKMTRSESFD